MAENRKLPFGYQMEYGEVRPHPAEADTVRWIFQRYLSGDPYSKLVAELQKRGVSYLAGKPWNKNMVARILEDRRYQGEQGFPAIIEPEMLDAAMRIRSTKQCPIQKTAAQKELRRLCGGNLPPHVERQVLDVMNQLTAQPRLIQCPECPRQESQQIRELQEALTDALGQPPVNEERARDLAKRLAAARLNAISSEEYETRRLQRLFASQLPKTALDADLIHTAIRNITVCGDGIIVQLKNGQHLEGGIQK
jgi:hypothetical protein